ncbi:MAG: hypothetical protein GWO07_02680 [Candidatus Dadabacteria bacterium]|nr:hypothetical protein [Candidatus Dadabacteria bacterium]NIV42252.1 hypothetical protein [Candidatus Dadabacteria bacterium]NIX14759.1 hypothetical protein [Candidatus Dadabacteria bacterium]
MLPIFIIPLINIVRLDRPILDGEKSTLLDCVADDGSLAPDSLMAMGGPY